MNNEDDDGMYRNEEDEEPTVRLGSDVNQPDNPFTKLFDRIVDKLKYEPQGAKKDSNTKTKQSCGNGKVTIDFAEMGEQKTKLYKLIFRNSIGKTLYEASIVGKHSKIRKVPEKAQKNQVKVLLIKFDY